MARSGTLQTYATIEHVHTPSLGMTWIAGGGKGILPTPDPVGSRDENG